MGALEKSYDLCPKKFAMIAVTESEQSCVKMRPGSSQCRPPNSREDGSSFNKLPSKLSGDIPPPSTEE